jgi:hypothetical protein
MISKLEFMVEAVATRIARKMRSRIIKRHTAHVLSDLPVFTRQEYFRDTQQTERE